MTKKKEKRKPNLVVNIPPATEFKASDAKTAARLSYRQLNDWGTKGALAGSRDSDSANWRRFNPNQLFVVSLCSEVRKAFSVPLDRLGWLQNEMLKDGRDYFQVAVNFMSQGYSVWLLTDLTEGLVMDPDVEFQQLIATGYFRDDDTGTAFIFVNVNPIVNRILGCLKEPVQLKVNPNAYKQFNK